MLKQNLRGLGALNIKNLSPDKFQLHYHTRLMSLTRIEAKILCFVS